MTDAATQLRTALIELNKAAHQAERRAREMNHSQAEALKMMAAYTARLVDTEPSPEGVRH